MILKSVLKKVGFASSLCSALMLASVPLIRSAAAQTIDGSAIDGSGAGDRATRLRALQSTVLDRAAVPSGQYQPSVLPDQTVPISPIESSAPPLPEDRSVAIATAIPVNNQLSIRLVNDTGTTVTYEVLGETTKRELMGGESAMLQGISLPATITTVRPDNGLIDVTADASEAGMLEISLMQEPTLDDTQGVIRIQSDGQVFVN